jgi:hypothetical protein
VDCTALVTGFPVQAPSRRNSERVSALADAARFEMCLHCVRDPLRHHLQASREAVDEARELADPDHLVRQRTDVRHALEGEHVMLADRMKIDAAQDDQLVGMFGERLRQNVRGRFVITRRHREQRLDDAARRIA